MSHLNKKVLSFSVLPLLDNFDLTYLKHLKSLGLNNVHYDVMDEFTGTRGFGPEHIRDLKNIGFNVNVHLMVKNIATTLLQFKNEPCDGISFHIEPLQSIQEGLEYIQFIKNLNKKAGIAIKMDTNLNEYLPLIQAVDYVTLMSVVPGKGGQAFDSYVFKNIVDLLTLCEMADIECPKIEFDGGITRNEMKKLWEFGSVFVSGSWFHKLTDIKKKILLTEINENLL